MLAIIHVSTFTNILNYRIHFHKMIIFQIIEKLSKLYFFCRAKAHKKYIFRDVRHLLRLIFT